MGRAQEGPLGVAVTMVMMAALLPSPSFASPEPEQPDFAAVIRTQAQVLDAVASDADAAALFLSHLGPALDLKDSATILSPSLSTKPPAPPFMPFDKAMRSELSATATQLTTELAAWRLAATLKEATDTGDVVGLKTALGRAARQRTWLFAGDTRQSLRRSIDLSAVLSDVAPAGGLQPISPSGYADYAAYLDRTYPLLTQANGSWVAVAEQEGVSGIRRRLAEFWTEGREAADKDLFANRYFQTVLRPVLAAHAIALAVRAEAEAERGAREAWTRLHIWRERLREMKGIERLCGTWHWTVHNHKNHQEHKLIMSFPPPATEAALPDPQASAGPPGPRPAKTVVLGDGVYLRWEFPGGYQEDSLLFAAEGQRLEGTFVNSAGAWGSITGKRVAPCPR
ncbi:MAG: hypothetical protein FJ249_00855 [Nitrospira sp.]|nr:hypothetical protein [Nitrospira sp.]